MLPEGGWAHVRAIRQVVSTERLHEVLLEPGDGFRDLLARGSPVTRRRSCEECGPVSRRMVISCWISGASLVTSAGSSSGVTSRISASSKAASSALNEMERETSSRRDRGTSISDAVCTIARMSNVSIMPRNGSRALTTSQRT